MTEEEGRRLGNMEPAVQRFTAQFRLSHETIEGAGPRIEAARTGLEQAEKGIGSTIETIRAGWRAPTTDVAVQLAALGQSLRRLRWLHAFLFAGLLVRRSWLQVRVFWHRHWRLMLIASALLVLAWLVVTYGPPAWAWVSGIVRDLMALIGRAP